MSLRRKILRKKAYKNWKKNMKGVPGKYKTSFSEFWKYIKEKGV